MDKCAAIKADDMTADRFTLSNNSDISGIAAIDKANRIFTLRGKGIAKMEIMNRGEGCAFTAVKDIIRADIINNRDICCFSQSCGIKYLGRKGFFRAG